MGGNTSTEAVAFYNASKANLSLESKAWLWQAISVINSETKAISQDINKAITETASTVRIPTGF